MCIFNQNVCNDVTFFLCLTPLLFSSWTQASPLQHERYECLIPHRPKRLSFLTVQWVVSVLLHNLHKLKLTHSCRYIQYVYTLLLVKHTVYTLLTTHSSHTLNVLCNNPDPIFQFFTIPDLVQYCTNKLSVPSSFWPAAKPKACWSFKRLVDGSGNWKAVWMDQNIVEGITKLIWWPLYLS